MESANKVLALMLGLIVVLVVIALILGKIGPLKGKGPITNGFVGRALGLRQPTPTKAPEEKKTFAQIRKTTTNQVPPAPQKKVVSPIKKNTDGSVTIKKSEMVAGATTKGGQPIQEIPATGVPVVLYPLAIAGLGAGLYLRRKN